MRDAFDAWVEAERGRFALWLPVAMAAGVVLYFAGRVEPPGWAGAAVAVPGLALAMAARHRMLLRACGLVALAAGLGFGSAQFATWRAPDAIEVPSRATFITARVLAVELLPAGRRILLGTPRFDDGPPLARSVRVRLRATDDGPLATGDRVRVRALLQRPSPPAYPGGWDLQRDAYFAGLGGYGTALGPVERLQAAEASQASLQGLRETIARRIGGSLAGAEAAIAATLLTGSAAAIPAADRAAFRDSGLSHLLAIAGLHIGIVMGLVFGATRGGLALSERAALFWPLKAVAACAALAAGLFYLLLTGAHVPILRSFAMASLVTLGVLAGRPTVSLRGLGLAMAAIVLAAPQEVVGVSFQMSFSAVLALIAGYGLLRPWLSRLHGEGWPRRLGAHVVGLALTSALAGTFSAPYAAHHFGHVQLYFILANMVAVPITALLVMPAGMVALLLMPLHLEALALTPMGWGIAAILWIAHATSDLPAATLAVAHIPPWGMAVFSLGLAWLGIWRSRWRAAGLAVMALGLAAPLFETQPDILVSADARLIGYHTDGVMMVQTHSGGSAFTRDAWQQFWATPLPQPLDCAGTHCLLQPSPEARPALLLRAEPDSSVCDQALLISAEPIRLRCPSQPPQIDRFTVWRQGAHAVWLRPGKVFVLSDRDDRGTRPWVLGLRLAGRLPPNTRPAQTEALPETLPED